MLTTTPLGFRSVRRTEWVSLYLLPHNETKLTGLMTSHHCLTETTQSTDNDVVNELGFILSLVLQHAQVIFGNDGRRRWLDWVRNMKAMSMEKSFSFYCKQQAALIRLQLIQNDAARVLTRTNSGLHISPMFACLHWFSITSRFTYKALNNQDPSCYSAHGTH